MGSEPPVWGSPPPAASTRPAGVQDAPAPGPAPPGPGAPPQVRWARSPAGLIPSHVIRRQATVSLVVNLMVLFMAFGMLSALGAAMALRARSLADADPVAARRSLSWSWIWLASNVLLYVLLGLMLLFFVISILTG